MGCSTVWLTTPSFFTIGTCVNAALGLLLGWLSTGPGKSRPKRSTGGALIGSHSVLSLWCQRASISCFRGIGMISVPSRGARAHGGSGS